MPFRGRVHRDRTVCPFSCSIRAEYISCYAVFLLEVICIPLLAQAPGSGFLDNFESSPAGAFPAGWLNGGSGSVALDNSIAAAGSHACV
jgi:hypothetical protein